MSTCNASDPTSNCTCNQCLANTLPFNRVPCINSDTDETNNTSERFLNTDLKLTDDDFVIRCNYYDTDGFSPLRNDGLNLFHLNSRSLNKNFNIISDYLSILTHNFSVIGFSETWFGNQLSPLINLDNYTLFENHRKEKRGGGVCIFVRNDYSIVSRDDLSIFNDSIESLFVEISNHYTRGKNIVGII